MPKFDMVTIGSATRDLFLESAQFRIIHDPTFSTGEAECFALGSKLEIPTVTDTIGGGGTNAAVGFSRLGFRTACAIRIGRDHRGAEITTHLRSERVRCFARIDGTERTALSVLLLTRRGERTVLIHRGASAHFSPSDVPPSTTRWYYITSLAGSLTTLRAVLARARRLGARIAWNPGAEELAWGFRRIRPLLNRVVILLNEFEVQQLTRCSGPRDGLRALIAAGASTAVVTAGKAGAYASDGRASYRSGIHAIPVTDTTGAGDAFGTGFVAALAQDRPLSLALQMGTANSEAVIRRIGAQHGLRRTFPSVPSRVRVERIPR